MSIFPYVYYMVESFHVAQNEKSIAMYAGMITSCYAFAEFSASVFWGRVSDRIGRKPVLLTGLAGTGISILAFGFSPNIWVAFVARAVGGLLNGNIGVINTTVAEMIKRESHQARAFSLMPGIWCIGSIAGAALGGALANPVKSYPQYFSPDGLFAKFPYLLPNLVAAGVVAFSVMTGILFLEETHEEKKYRYDPGLQLGLWLRNLVFPSREDFFDEKAAMMNGGYHIVRGSEDSDLSEFSSIDSSPALLPVTDIAEVPEFVEPKSLESGQAITTDKSVSGAFTKQVVLVIVSYGLLAFHTISAEQLLPVMLSLPKSDKPIHLPFLFSGGFDLPTKNIGFILSGQGLVQTFAVLVVFPLVSKRIGSLATYRLAVLSYPLFYFLVPYLAILPATIRMPMLYVFVVWKVFAQGFALPPIHILLANAAPSKLVLGTLNGTAASSASLCRGFGPTLSGLIQAAGLSFGCLGLPWWTSSAIAIVAAVLSLMITESNKPSPTPALQCNETSHGSEMPPRNAALVDDAREIS